MARHSNKSTAMARRCSCSFIFILLCAFSIFSFLYTRRYNLQIATGPAKHSIDLLTYSGSWNSLTFQPDPPPELLKIAGFVKKWPHSSHAGGLERHALTLYLALAERGHEIHVFTTNPPTSFFPKYPFKNLYFHLTRPTSGGYLDQALVWDQFVAQNSTSSRPFDAVHTESVALTHTRSRNIPNLAVSWHGIAYETIHSDIMQELLRSPEEPQSLALSERPMKVVEEVKFFRNYAHHVATSDHMGDVLKRVYMIPEERVHVILNGVDEAVFKPDFYGGLEFLSKFGKAAGALVLGLSGRLVKDKGHPVMFEALNQMFNETPKFRDDVLVLVAGDGPWGSRYRELGSNVVVLGPLEQTQLAEFYNAIDIFVNPTLRAQGLDQTPLEAILSAKPVLVTRVASMTGSVVVGEDIMGYTFPPTVESLKKVLYRVWRDGRGELEKKGRVARERGLNLFAATKMVAAYERLFLCISSRSHCQFKHR